MNEHQLLSWQPRRPSAALKRRLFGAAEPDLIPAARWLWSLAPTMACALVALVALNHDNGINPMAMPLVLSNQANAAYASGGAATERNHLATVTFDWTNRSVFQSSMRFTPSTNLTN